MQDQKSRLLNAAGVKLSLENFEDYIQRSNAQCSFFVCVNIAGREFFAGRSTLPPSVHIVSSREQAQRYSCDEANEIMRTLWVNHAFPVYSKIAGLSPAEFDSAREAAAALCERSAV